MPSLANRPEELTASNGATSTLESLAVFVGPAIGALLIGVTSVPVVFLVNAATFLWSMVLVLGIRVPAPAAPADLAASENLGAEPGPGAGVVGDDADPAVEEQKQGFFGEISAGFRLIAKDRDLLVVTAVGSAQTVVAGRSSVFMVVMAVSILRHGSAGRRLSRLRLRDRLDRGRFLRDRPCLAPNLGPGHDLRSRALVAAAARRCWVSPVTAFAAAALLGLGNPSST